MRYRYELKSLHDFSLIVVFSLNCITTSFVTNGKCINVIYDATVGKFCYNPRCSSTIVSEPELPVMHNFVVHSPKSNFSPQLFLKINATF